MSPSALAPQARAPSSRGPRAAAAGSAAAHGPAPCFRRLRGALAALALCLSPAAAGAAGAAPAGARAVPEAVPASAPVVALRRVPGAPVLGPGFIGANNLYWIDDDRAWADERFRASLARIGIGALRFPGGEVADNYDWETNRLEQPYAFPVEEPTEAELDARLDWREFLAATREAGIEERFFVVNLEGAFVAPGDREAAIARYADKAARWVAAVRAAGYRVAYWEIGNESYMNGRVALTASEYARALRVYARAMRAADPTIRIGAIGPPGFTPADGAGFADRMGPELPRLRAAGENPCKGQSLPDCFERFGLPREGTGGAPAWWDVLLREAADSFDFAVIHRYRPAAGKHGAAAGVLERQIAGLKAHLAEAKGAPVMLALTEWNTPARSPLYSDPAVHALETIELIGSYLAGGVDYTVYWPLRLKGEIHALLRWKDYGLDSAGATLAFARRYVGSARAAREGDAGGLRLFASATAGGYRVLLVNRDEAERCVALRPDGRVPRSLSADVLQAAATPPTRPLVPRRRADGSPEVCVPGKSAAGVELG